MDSNEYELEIHVYKKESFHRRRLSTIYIVQINVSPFHFWRENKSNFYSNKD